MRLHAVGGFIPHVHSGCYTLMPGLRVLERLLSLILNVSSDVTAANIVGQRREETLQRNFLASLYTTLLNLDCACELLDVQKTTEQQLALLHVL